MQRARSEGTIIRCVQKRGKKRRTVLALGGSLSGIVSWGGLRGGALYIERERSSYNPQRKRRKGNPLEKKEGGSSVTLGKDNQWGRRGNKRKFYPNYYERGGGGVGASAQEKKNA